MLRCVTLAAVVCLGCLPAAAQMARNFPATALRGEIAVTQPPDVLLNRRPARLAPGARIRGQNNLMLVSGALVDQRLVVHYTTDQQGLLTELWILTPEELARRPWPTTPEQAAGWRFDAASQSWSRP